MTIFYIFLFSLIIFLYLKIWNKFSNKVPTGIGIILIIPCFFLYIDQNLNFISIISLLIFSLIYFLDDLIEINFFFRIVLQIFASIIIYFSLVIDINIIIYIFNLITFLIIVNTLNFQDGEDLNIAILLIIIFGIFYFHSENISIQNTSKIILLFLISFSFFNIKKKFLYFGYSGCYFISIIIFLFLYNEINNLVLIKFLAGAIAYPIIDVFYVLVYRIFNRQNLLSRNYLHLYQILAQKINSKIYLLPNILFSILNIFILSNFSLGKNLIAFLIIINIALLFLIRLTINKLIN